MTLDDILNAKPTRSPDQSRGIVIGWLQNGWRVYSTQRMDADPLIERFLRSHAVIPGLVTETIPATHPLDIVFWIGQDGDAYKGAGFLNGAVFVARDPAGVVVRSLLIEDSTAVKWGYPDDFVSMEASHATDAGQP